MLKESIGRMTVQKRNTKIVAATEADTEEILRLYKAQLGQEFCPWDEHYPERENIAFDLERDALFVMKNEKDEIIAAISIDEDPNVEELICWSRQLQPGGELARLAVRRDYQNQGIARTMIEYAMDVLRRQGKKSVHYLVNRNNIKAVRSYEHLHFSQVGSCEMYEQPFLCYEQKL